MEMTGFQQVKAKGPLQTTRNKVRVAVKYSRLAWLKTNKQNLQTTTTKQLIWKYLWWYLIDNGPNKMGLIRWAAQDSCTQLFYIYNDTHKKNQYR